MNLRTLRPRAHNRHGSAQYIEKLGQLVYAGLADESTYRRNAAVMIPGKSGSCILFRIDYHTAELHYIKNPAVLGQALLFVKNRSSIVQMNRQGCSEHYRRSQDNSN